MLYYQLNIDYIIETYCINKEKPELQCNGKCHLAQQLRAVNPSDQSSETVTILHESFFPVFSEKPLDLNIKSLVISLKRQKIISSQKGYFNSFEYRHFRPPIV